MQLAKNIISFQPKGWKEINPSSIARKGDITHDGEHSVLVDDHEHHDKHHHERKSDRAVKLIAGLIAVGLVAAFVLWKLI